jgi:N-acetyl-gamma-glutamyl-phosphate reductase
VLADRLPGGGPRILDASTAHRVAPGWVYGFAELSDAQGAAIAKSRRVANPGCYPTGGIALLRPLVDAGLVPADYPISVNAVSGYSGGGKSMIAAYEAGAAPAFELYGLGLEHKHLPELQQYSGLSKRPIFVPSVGNFRQGMLVSVPLHLDTLPGKPTCRDLASVLESRYRDTRYVTVVAASDASRKGGRIEAESLNDSNRMELTVFGSDSRGQAVLVAKLDNLGKGASGAAVQNIELMLGLG